MRVLKVPPISDSLADLTKDCRQQGQTLNTYYMPEGSHLWTNLSCTVTQITSGFIDENIKVGRSYITHLMSHVNNDEAGVYIHVCMFGHLYTHECVCVHMNICVTCVSVYTSVPLVWTCVCACACGSACVC